MEFYLGFCIVDYDTKQRIKPLANNSSQVRSKPLRWMGGRYGGNEFQSLIGKIKTLSESQNDVYGAVFQSLIGKIKTRKGRFY